jgi:aminocarboxymuconate-semialdehyde decarboxylase
VNFPLEIGAVASALIVRGGALRIPDLRLALSHGGGSALPTLPRLVDAYETTLAVRQEMPWHPLEAARSLFYDAAVFSRVGLDPILATVGPERLLLGSDFPFMRVEPDRALHEYPAGTRAELVSATATAADHWLGLPRS